MEEICKNFSTTLFIACYSQESWFKCHIFCAEWDFEWSRKSNTQYETKKSCRLGQLHLVETEAGGDQKVLSARSTCYLQSAEWKRSGTVLIPKKRDREDICHYLQYTCYHKCTRFLCEYSNKNCAWRRFKQRRGRLQKAIFHYWLYFRHNEVDWTVQGPNNSTMSALRWFQESLRLCWTWRLIKPTSP